MLTEKELKQIYDYLVLRGKKDSQLETITYPASFTDSDSIAVIHNSNNKSISIKDLESCFLHTFTTDSDYSTVIDNVPTQDSTNLVKSGGVYSAIDTHVVNTSQLANNAVTKSKLSTEVQNILDTEYKFDADNSNSEVNIGIKKNNVFDSTVKIQGTGVVSVSEAVVSSKPVITIDVPQTLHWVNNFDALVAGDQLIEGHLYAVLPSGSTAKNLIQYLHMAVGVDSYITLWRATV